MNAHAYTDQESAFQSQLMQLYAQTFSLSQKQILEHNEIWNEWLSLEKREWHDLQTLLQSEVNDAFKARAAVILLIPDMHLNPFAWKHGSHSRNYLLMDFKWDPSIQSRKLQLFLCQMLLMNIEYVHAHPDDEQLQRCARTFNNMIIGFLSWLPEDSPFTELLFQKFHINDLVPFSDLEEASGYNPFERLLRSPVPEKWKRRADQQMRQIIVAEQYGQAVPRAEWEKAESCYREHVQFTLLGKPFPYSVDFFASQVDFILKLYNPEKKSRFRGYHLLSIFTLLKADAYENIRHRLASQAVLEASGQFERFRIHDKETRAVTSLMLTQFSEDAELCNRLRAILAEADAENQAGQKNVDEKTKRAEAVLARMQ